MDPLRTSSDEVAYPTRPQSALHPDRLGGIGLLHGFGCVPLDGARVLEIGCGNGFNLISLAAGHPGARFVGLDAAAVAIGAARDLAARCGLRNIEFLSARLEDQVLVGEEFDYVLCHGVYSWVPEATRASLLGLVSRCLALRGVAFVSYNALPGWHVRSPVREILQWHVREIRGAGEQLEEAKALSHFLAGAIVEDTPAGKALRAEFASAAARDPQVLWHDELSPEHRAFYFHEFIAAAEAHGLSYLADADLIEHMLANMDPRVVSALRSVAANRIELEQYVDFLVPRRFRQTLLVRSGQVVGEADVQRLAEGWVRAGASLKESENQPGVGKARFESGKGHSLETDFGPGVRALRLLMAAVPSRVSVPELVRRVGDEGLWARADLIRFLFEAAAGGLVEWAATGSCPAVQPGGHPTAFGPARVLAETSTELPSALHRLVRLEESAPRELLRLCDGTRTRDQLLQALLETKSKPDAVTIQSRPQLDEVLGQLGRMGLFVG